MRNGNGEVTEWGMGWDGDGDGDGNGEEVAEAIVR